jgi:hypothetical protein
MTTSLLAQQTAAVSPTPAAPPDETPIHETQTPVPTPVTLRKWTEINLVLLEPVSSATAVKGQQVKFAVAKDVVVDGLVVIPRGAQATGVVAKTQSAIKGKRDGYVVLETRKVALGNGSWMNLRDARSGGSSCDDFCIGGDDAVALIFLSPFILAGVLLVSPFWIAALLTSKPPQIEGKDNVLQPCWNYTRYTSNDLTIPANAAQAGQPASIADQEQLKACPLPNRPAVAN